MENTLNTVLNNIRQFGGGKSEADVLTWALGDKAREFAHALHRIACGQATTADVEKIEPAL